MTSEENEKRDCREARFSLEGSKSCPNLGKHLNLSVNNIVHELNSVVQKRRRFATRRRVPSERPHRSVRKPRANILTKSCWNISRKLM